MRILLAGLLVMASLAGCVSEASETQSVDDEPTPFVPIVTVAVLDTGINPYHNEFSEQYIDAEPATYIPGYPEAELLELSEWSDGGFNRAPDDVDLWEATSEGTLYRVADSKIVGLISFGGDLPGGGHGTMTASRATGNTISIGGEAIRLVVVRGFSAEAINWVADQEWIDMASMSASGTMTGIVPGPGNAEGALSGVSAAFQNLAHKKPFFASTGNGVVNAGLVGFPVVLRGPSGAPDVISVGANNNGQTNAWANFPPYVVGDGCANPSARDNSEDEISNTGGGTSSSTPFSAGGGATMLLEARRILGDSHVGPRYSDEPFESWSGWSSEHDGDANVILAQGEPGIVTEGPLADGYFTLQEFKDVLYHTAVAGMEDESDGGYCLDPEVPKDNPGETAMDGYGEINNVSIEASVAVLLGGPMEVDEFEDEAYILAHHQRAAVYQE